MGSAHHHDTIQNHVDPQARGPLFQPPSTPSTLSNFANPSRKKPPAFGRHPGFHCPGTECIYGYLLAFTNGRLTHPCTRHAPSINLMGAINGPARQHSQVIVSWKAQPGHTCHQTDPLHSAAVRRRLRKVQCLPDAGTIMICLGTFDLPSSRVCQSRNAAREMRPRKLSSRQQCPEMV